MARLKGRELMEATQHFANTYRAARSHAKTCRKCYYPIMDDEGNPGYRSEACSVGTWLLAEFLATEALLKCK